VPPTRFKTSSPTHSTCNVRCKPVIRNRSATIIGSSTLTPTKSGDKRTRNVEKRGSVLRTQHVPQHASVPPPPLFLHKIFSNQRAPVSPTSPTGPLVQNGPLSGRSGRLKTGNGLFVRLCRPFPIVQQMYTNHQPISITSFCMHAVSDAAVCSDQLNGMWLDRIRHSWGVGVSGGGTWTCTTTTACAVVDLFSMGICGLGCFLYTFHFTVFEGPGKHSFRSPISLLILLCPNHAGGGPGSSEHLHPYADERQHAEER